MIRVIVNGIDGAMGTHVVKCVEAADDMEVVAGITPTGWNGSYLTPQECKEEGDVLIDFSHHDGTKALVDYCVEKGLPAVICTTGQTEEEMEYIKAASAHIAVFKSANMSLGVALTAKVVKEVAAKFPGCEIEIVEAHHNRKVDAPSGTALMLADAVIESRPELHVNAGRSGIAKREPDEIGISAIRMGNVVGTHEVMFGTANQTITVKHEAHDRALFADGAIAAARFLIGKPAGLYNMDDLVSE